MKELFQCETCGQIFDNPSEAILCEQNGPQPKFQLGEEVILNLGPIGESDREAKEQVTIKEIVLLLDGIIRYIVTFPPGEDSGPWTENILQKIS